MYQNQTRFSSGTITVQSELLQPNINLIMELMRSIGIGKIIAEYSGGGDSGGMEDIKTYPISIDIAKYKVQQFDIHSNSGYYFGRKDFEPIFPSNHRTFQWRYAEVSPNLVLLPANQAIEEIWYACIEQYFPGWEINEGSYGQLIFVNDPEHEGCYVSLDHNQHYIETENTQYDIFGNSND